MIDALLNVATFVVLVLFIIGFGVDRPNARHRPREGRQHARDGSQFSGLTAIVGDLYNIQMQVTAVLPPGDVDGAGTTIDHLLCKCSGRDRVYP